MIIEYCEGCGLRISESELQDGSAVKLDNKSYHAKCAPVQSVKKGLNAPAAESPVQGDARGSKVVLRPARRDTKTIPRPTPASGVPQQTAAPVAQVDPSPRASTKWLWIGGGVAAAAGLLLIVVFSGSSEPGKKPAQVANASEMSPKPVATKIESAPPKELKEPVAPKSEAVTLKFGDKDTEKPNPGGADKEMENLRIERAAKLLQEAKAFAKDHPGEAKKFHDKLSTVMTTYRSTPAADEAAKLIAEIKLPEPVKLADDDPAWKRAISLIPLIDPAQDTVSGTWKSEGGALTVSKSRESRLHLPYQPGEEYDLRVVFTRNEGNDYLTHLISIAGRSFIWVMSADYNKVFGFSHVKGAGATGNATSVKGRLENNRKYTLILQLRADGVNAFLDGTMVSSWDDYKDMSLPHSWKMRSDTALGLGNKECRVTYHSIDVLDLKGAGKPLRTEAQAAIAAAQTAPPKADPGKTAAEDSAAAVAGARLEYEKTISDVYALLGKDGLAQAQARLEKARADKQLAPMKAELELDAQLARMIGDLNKACLEGAKVLTDKRPFTFKKADGKEVVSGKGTSVSVVGVKNDAIEIEESMGGGKIQAKIDMEQLSAGTKYELARMGLPPGPESFLKLAFGGFVLLQNGSGVVTLKDVRNSLELARKGQASPEQVKHLAGRLDFYELDLGGEAAYRKVEALAKEKKWEAAKAGLDEYKREYLGTKSAAKLQPEIDKLAADIEFALMPLKPGLWASYWTLDSKEKPKAKVLARPETKISQDWGAGSPDKAVPTDNFGALFGGLLRVEQEGKYKFLLAADDKAWMKIDGKGVKNNEDMRLTKGDHEIQIVFGEGGGAAKLSVKWKLEGGAEQDLPPAALWHDPKQIEKYEKK